MGCDNPALIITRHAKGDIEYLFALNGNCSYRKAGPKDKFDSLTAIPATATLTLPADGRPVYDAVRGGKVSELSDDGELTPAEREILASAPANCASLPAPRVPSAAYCSPRRC